MLLRISSHAVDRYMQFIDSSLTRGQARVALFRVFRMSRVATEYEIREYHRRPDGEVDYMIADTCYGVLCMPVKQGVVMTIYDVRKPE